MLSKKNKNRELVTYWRILLIFSASLLRRENRKLTCQIFDIRQNSMILPYHSVLTEDCIWGCIQALDITVCGKVCGESRWNPDSRRTVLPLSHFEILIRLVLWSGLLLPIPSTRICEADTRPTLLKTCRPKNFYFYANKDFWFEKKTKISSK